MPTPKSPCWVLVTMTLVVLALVVTVALTASLAPDPAMRQDARLVLTALLAWWPSP
jgi:hypothetical protein